MDATATATEVDNKILSDLSYLDISDELADTYARYDSITVKQFLDYYKSYKTDAEVDAQLHDRFKGEEYDRWTNFIDHEHEVLKKYYNWKITNYVSNNKQNQSGFVVYFFDALKLKII